MSDDSVEWNHARCFDGEKFVDTWSGWSGQMSEYKYIDVPKYHEGKRVMESKLEICPLCHDTKTVSTPLQTIKMIIDPEYRTECSKCKVWWYTYRTEFRS